MSSVVFSRSLRQPGAHEGGLSEVAVATYAPEKKGDPARQAVSTISRADGTLQMCVEVDSIQSQANRVEAELLRLRNENRIRFPRVDVEIQRKDDIPIILDQLEIGHRIAGAELRNSTFSTKEHRYRPHPLVDIRTDATYILTWSIQSLLLGAWNSMEVPHWKLPRIWEARVMGYGPPMDRETYNATKGEGINCFSRGSQKIDHLLNASRIKVESIKAEKGSLKKDDSKAKGLLPPVSASNVTPKGDARISTYMLGDIPGGVNPSNRFNFASIEQRVFISRSSIDRFCFPADDGRATEERNKAGREMVRTLGDLFSAILFTAPLDYRSGCQLAPVPGTTRKITINDDGSETSSELPDAILDQAISAWHSALDAGEKVRLALRDFHAKAMPNFENAVNLAGKHLLGDTEDLAPAVSE